MELARTISSLTNDRVKFVRSLEMRKVRRETGLFVAEGQSLLVTARDCGWIPAMLLYDPAAATGAIAQSLVRWASGHRAEVLSVTPAILEKLAAKENPQAMLGVFEQRWQPLPDPAGLKNDDVWLALEEVRDPGNLGTILRTVDAVGARGILLVGPCADAWSREAIRATMGSIFAVPLARATAEEFLAWRQHWPGDVVGTHLQAREDVRHARYRGPVLAVMGSEGPGLSEPLTSACSRLVKIPMAGRLDSLNLAVATALTLFEIRRPHLKL